MYPVPLTRSGKTVMFFFCYVLFSIQFVKAQCIASGPNSPGAAVSDATGDYSFTNPSNCFSSDNSRATAQSLLFSGETDTLKATDFGFSIPTAATICGIEVNIEKSSSIFILNTAYVTDNSVRIIKNGKITGSDLEKTNVVWPTGDANTTYGYNGELWGTSWTPSDINSANFGIAISAKIVGDIGLFPAARIDYISMTVYYLAPSLLSAQSIQFTVANATSNSAQLSWNWNGDEAASFTVERSANGTKWEPVNGSLQKNNLTSAYTFNDVNPLTGRSFYRLKTLSASGEVRYSTVQPFELTAIPVLKCYPNPVTSLVTVYGVTAGEQITVTNLFGQQVYQSPPALNNTVSINFNELQPGIYVISAGNRKMKVQKK
ncbi:hypothetical protein A3860_04525 [Niastella vici]|uniref:Secretion system C-terminal sorting domain-containing protein n=1 Tax=Niastella vici TaxID=1703345 RepID=A0A1V9FRL8_9BACT|nr:T9SS type A sorting domain-containing protein [Niastella vici]OQP60994.1 hypothetical protein A3860_04525 [Niastella vici]